ncbi:hypothetical protein [Streptacidiphilus sp. EB129]|uniref:hypothetical protein n=1 Tax=Streptacidiphilus sp. EB129 TaxID=3156262 RepID=UPI0035122EF8
MADLVQRLANALGRTRDPIPPPAPVLIDSHDDWNHHRIRLQDGPVPLNVDILAATDRAATRTVYLLPGGGLNTAADFLTPRGRGLAHFLCANGFLVIGVSPREDGLTSVRPDVRDWGLVRHRQDVLRVVGAVHSVLPMPYDLLGHSAGAVLALDVAAAAAAAEAGSAGAGAAAAGAAPAGSAPAGDVPVPGPVRVLVMDTTGPYDPRTEPELVARAEALLAATRELLAQGTLVVDPGLKALFARAAADPLGSSPVPRPVEGPASCFTNAGLLHYALTHTRRLPGPANWIYHQGFSSGSYRFRARAEEDRFALDHTPIGVWSAAVDQLGSGVQPTALLRDLAAVWAGREDVHRIDWSAVRAEVIWVNAGLGRGDHDRGARLIRERSGSPVRFTVVPGYGHGDVVWSATAGVDVWPSLVAAPALRGPALLPSPTPS